jgi:hypothetical protein
LTDTETNPDLYVGIGTTEPQAHLDVNGDVIVAGFLTVEGGMVIPTCVAGSCPDDVGTPQRGQIWIVVDN